MQVDPIKPTFTAPGAKRFKLKYDELLSSVAFNFNLRRYIKLENLLLKRDDDLSSVVIADFGLAKRCRESSSRNMPHAKVGLGKISPLHRQLWFKTPVS